MRDKVPSSDIGVRAAQLNRQTSTFTVVVLVASYGVLLATMFYVSQGSWSGLVSLGNFAVILFSIPFLLVRAWQLRPTRMNRGFSPLLWLLALMFPILYVGLAAVAVTLEL
jgi:hypothetical protein